MFRRPLRELCHILSEYRDLLCKSPYSVQMREKFAPEKAPNTGTFYTVVRFCSS